MRIKLLFLLKIWVLNFFLKYEKELCEYLRVFMGINAVLKIIFYYIKGLCVYLGGMGINV